MFLSLPCEVFWKDTQQKHMKQTMELQVLGDVLTLRFVASTSFALGSLSTTINVEANTSVVAGYDVVLVLRIGHSICFSSEDFSVMDGLAQHHSQRTRRHEFFFRWRRGDEFPASSVRSLWVPLASIAVATNALNSASGAARVACVRTNCNTMVRFMNT